MRFARGHNGRTGNQAPRVYTPDGYVRVWAPEHPNATGRGYVPEHVLIVSNALGRPIPPGAEVHHANQVKSDNRPCNLVLCPDRAYHSLLHQRLRALEACGNPNWLPCKYCHKYDAPEALQRVGKAAPGIGWWTHRDCRNEHQRRKARPLTDAQKARRAALDRIRYARRRELVGRIGLLVGEIGEAGGAIGSETAESRLPSLGGRPRVVPVHPGAEDGVPRDAQRGGDVLGGDVLREELVGECLEVHLGSRLVDNG